MSTDVTVTVTIHDSPQQRSSWTNAAAVVLTVVFVAYAFGWLSWLAAAAAVYVAVWIGGRMFSQARASELEERRRLVEIAARADQQHAWFLAGDERGVYGSDGAELMRRIRHYPVSDPLSSS
jgi:hypothetical protein